MMSVNQFDENAEVGPAPVNSTDTVALDAGLRTRALIRIRPEWRKLQLIIGILAIALGPLGAHKFALGYFKAGVLTLLFTTLCCVLFAWGAQTVDPGIWIGVPLLWIIGATEGFIYLTLPPHIFYRVYLRGFHPWF